VRDVLPGASVGRRIAGRRPRANHRFRPGSWPAEECLRPRGSRAAAPARLHLETAGRLALVGASVRVTSQRVREPTAAECVISVRDAPPCGLSRRWGTPSGTAAESVDEVVHVDIPSSAPCRHVFAVDRIGQVMQGRFGNLRKVCLPQEVNHVLPGELHCDHRTLTGCWAACPWRSIPNAAECWVIRPRNP